MSNEEFRAKLQEAKTIVENWPDWKKSALENSFKANNPGPREPVMDENSTRDPILASSETDESIQ